MTPRPLRRTGRLSIKHLKPLANPSLALCNSLSLDNSYKTKTINTGISVNASGSSVDIQKDRLSKTWTDRMGGRRKSVVAIRDAGLAVQQRDFHFTGERLAVVIADVEEIAKLAADSLHDNAFDTHVERLAGGQVFGSFGRNGQRKNDDDSQEG